MPLPLSSIAIQEKNKLLSDSVFLVALRIIIPGIADPIRVVNNSENIIWCGEIWVAFPFTINEISESSGEVPRVDIQISNVNRSMEVYMQYYDDYIKANGYTPITVNIYVINTAVIAVNGYAEPEVAHEFELKQPKADSKWATFTLGASNPYNRRFPQNRILKNHCRFRFKGSDGRCGYSGLLTECDHTLASCRIRLNSERFGGFPGAGKSGFEID